MVNAKTPRMAMPVNSTPWTSEKISILRSLWATDMSTKAIGDQLGCTKNSVIGKARRLKLSSRLGIMPKNMASLTSSSTAERVIAAYKAVTFMDLRHDMCSWIHSDTIDHGVTFCGKRILPSHSYCPDHCSKAFMKAAQPKVAIDFYTEQDMDDALAKP